MGVTGLEFQENTNKTLTQILRL